MGTEKLAAPAVARAPEPVRAQATRRPSVDRVAAPQFLPEVKQPSVDPRTRELLATLRTGVEAAAEAELAGSGWTAETCPWIEYWFRYYERRSPDDVVAALRKFARVTTLAEDPSEYIAPALDRVRTAVRHWRATGEIDAALSQHAADSRAAIAALGESKPLEGDVRARMERGFGRELSDVRIHTGAAASRVVRAQHAPAVTIGSSIAFDAATYRPGTLAGDAILAHEIAHTAQQNESGPASPSESRDEANADASAMRAMLRLAGAPIAAPQTRPTGGLALRRCNSQPTFTPSYTPKQWAQEFRKQYPQLENISHPEGVRDDGIMTAAGVRVPQQPGHLLKPRPFYYSREAALLVYQGFVHYAELVEAHHDPAAVQIAEALLQKTGRSIPDDREMDLAAYAHWSYKAKASAEGAQVGLMAADVAMMGADLALTRTPTTRSPFGANAVSGEIDAASGAAKGQVTTGPKVVVDQPPVTAPKPVDEPAPAPPKAPDTTASPPTTKPAPTKPPATEVDTRTAAKAKQDPEQIRRYDRYQRTSKSKLGFDEWWEKYGRRPAPNPYGKPGKPDHVTTIDEKLEAMARKEFPNDIVVKGESIQGLKTPRGKTIRIDREPDVTVIDAADGKTVKKVYEAARTNADGTLVGREVAKQKQYNGLGVPSHFEPVTGK